MTNVQKLAIVLNYSLPKFGVGNYNESDIVPMAAELVNHMTDEQIDYELDQVRIARIREFNVTYNELGCSMSYCFDWDFHQEIRDLSLISV